MTTNSNKFKKQVQEYILECIDDCESVKSVFESFKEQVGHNIKRVGTRKAFVSWLQGLPSEIFIDFYTNEQMNIMRSWFENCGVFYDEKRFNYEHFYHFVTREFMNLLKKEGITV